MKAIVVFREMIVRKPVAKENSSGFLEDEFLAVDFALVDLDTEQPRKLLVNMKPFIEQRRELLTRLANDLGSWQYSSSRPHRANLGRGRRPPQRSEELDQIATQSVDVVAIGAPIKRLARSPASPANSSSALSKARSSMDPPGDGASRPNATVCCS